MHCCFCVCVDLFLRFSFGLVSVGCACLFACFRALGLLSSGTTKPVGYMPGDAGDHQMQKACLGTRPTQRKGELRDAERDRGGERERETRF